MTTQPISVLVWNEYQHELENETVAKVYPEGIHAAIKAGLEEKLDTRVTVTTATLAEPEHGLTQSALDATDVLVWWGHKAHDQVDDAVVNRVQQRVLNGMGLIVLHSGHASKIFQRLMGTGCMLRWREAGELERLWITRPGHPITAGLDGGFFEVPQAEMYGEFFDIPQPDEVVFISWFSGGEVFRSGCTFHRGKGKIFYFRPGHETYPIYYQDQIKQVIANAVQWATPTGSPYFAPARNIESPLNPF